MQKNYCMSCGKEVSSDTEQCDCGGRCFVYGDKFHFNEKGIVCDCGNNEFQNNMHMDWTHKAVSKYSCTKCGNVVGTESYRSKDDLMFFE